MALKFFHTPKSKQFNYKPRYYDERKEELENRINQIKKEMGKEDLSDSEKPYTSNIKGQIRRSGKRTKVSKDKSNLRLILIIVILFALIYFFFLR
ncbi:MAG: hypothetical protein A2X13_11055 [Bacteroidetes bacterium GWC2_33_15]|nr:MAG: hypothetical protein A2X10_11155 [Bacteroidetes bacterium GWA2_33_15]OFX52582.1 MAG: hypothetical protein A2X13_11055 [Bacteroidetes bacterium GWC2_33_15]OFX63927.1 MAG: hypothetical protein A2X15_03400 [Bacteroidetes bacterium GWB2_32_14]OFX70806.1 MAG: hypothetical protein A2X14_00190 [Bacteroidetes bacterium GWD2_33_33]HAN19934.1 hypothetical protein [Bacteroidales bacterium]